MAQYIKTLIENGVDTIYPVTKSTAVYMNDGTTTVENAINTLNGNLLSTVGLINKTTTITGSGIDQVITEVGDTYSAVTTSLIDNQGNTVYTTVYTIGEKEYTKTTTVPPAGSPIVEEYEETTSE